jgi:hypothetical protein
MPSVHKDYRGKTPFWIGAYVDELGRRRKQSTKTEDKREAKTIVEGWQRAADSAQYGPEYLKAGTSEAFDSVVAEGSLEKTAFRRGFRIPIFAKNWFIFTTRIKRNTGLPLFYRSQ